MWPPFSPDLSPTESVWDCIEDHMLKNLPDFGSGVQIVNWRLREIVEAARD